LNMLLNNHHAMQSLGEVHRLSLYARTDHETCTCGQRVLECDFWNEVAATFEHLGPRSKSPRETLCEQDMMLYPKDSGAINALVETVTLVMGRQRVFEQWNRFFGGAHRDAIDTAWQWFDAIGRTTGKSWLVDSTKDLRRGKMLYLSKPRQVKFVWMIRDGRAVAASAMRRADIDIATAAKQWWHTIIRIRATLLSVPNDAYSVVRYEDICVAPESVLKKLGTDLGFVFDPQMLTLDKSLSHDIGGNPMRFRKDETKILLDEGWRRQLTECEKQTFQEVAGKQNRSLGYDGGPYGSDGRGVELPRFRG